MRHFLALLTTMGFMAQPATAIPVTFQIDGYFTTAYNYSGTWSGMNLQYGDPYVALLTVDDAALPVSSYSDFPSQRGNYYAVSSLNVKFPRTNGTVDLSSGNVYSRVTDYDRNLNVSLLSKGVQADGSSVTVNTYLAYEDRLNLSQPTLLEAIYLLDKQKGSMAGGFSLTHNGGVWDYGTCQVNPATNFGQCSLGLRLTGINIVTPGYTVAVPDSVLNPVLAPVPLPGGFSALALGLLGTGLFARRRSKSN